MKKSSFEKIQKEYLEGLIVKIDKINKALAQNDMEEIKFFSHKIRGSGASYFFDEITEIGKKMSEARKNDDKNQIQKLLDELKDFVIKTLENK